MRRLLLLTATLALIAAGAAPAAAGTPDATGPRGGATLLTASPAPAAAALTGPPARTAAPAGQYVEIYNQNGRLERFWRGSDCALWHEYQLSVGGPWSGPASLGGCLLNFATAIDIDVSRNGDGRLEAFGIGLNQAMFHIWQLSPGGVWSGWASMDGILVSRPYSANFSSSDRRLYVDALGPDNVWHRRYQTAPSCCWSGWVFGTAH